ncbi:MAG: ATP-dependent DNA helicase RecQ [Bacteroidota bacterium]
MRSPIEILKEIWGYDQFRPLQEDIVNGVLKGHDVLALLPTGGGKSICFQVPAIALDGICIVISPLIALMKDQVEQLNKRGVAAIAIYSGLSAKEIDIALDNCVYGKIKFLYLSPERLLTEMFRERVQRMKVGLLAVDEAHCISQWGYDFRPPYLQIAELRALLPDVNIIALTATATKEVSGDIQEKLRFNNAQVFQKSFARPNLSYSVRYVEDKEKKLLEILRRVPGTAVVYVRSRRRTKEIAVFLRKNRINADFYHAGLSNEERAHKQEAWINDQTRVIVSTNAFGMGIDKPDVRVVVHMDLPDTLEAYYQEAGRAGRDEKKAFAVVLYDSQDTEDLVSRVTKSYPDMQTIRKTYQSLANYYKIAVGSSEGESFDFDIQDFVSAFNLDYTEVYFSLKKLESEGFIQLNEGYYNPSKVIIAVDNKKLYEFQIAYARFDSLIKALLRIYGGELFTTYLRVDEKALAQYLGTTERDIYEQLTAMDNLKVITYEKRKDKPQLTLLTHRYDASNLPLNETHLMAMKDRDIAKMKSVIQYVENDHRCRTQQLLEYFDEVSYERCGVCDYCVDQRSKAHEIDMHSMHELVIKLLEQHPLPIEELVDKIDPKNKEELLEVIKLMVDSEELYYDNQWTLHVKKEH